MDAGELLQRGVTARCTLGLSASRLPPTGGCALLPHLCRTAGRCCTPARLLSLSRDSHEQACSNCTCPAVRLPVPSLGVQSPQIGVFRSQLRIQTAEQRRVSRGKVHQLYY